MADLLDKVPKLPISNDDSGEDLVGRRTKVDARFVDKKKEAHPDSKGTVTTLQPRFSISFTRATVLLADPHFNSPQRRIDYEQPVVPPQLSHFRHVPFRTRVSEPHSGQGSPS
jgi:hypothetical protein